MQDRAALSCHEATHLKVEVASADSDIVSTGDVVVVA